MLFSKLFYPSLSYWYQPLLFALWCFGNLKVKFAKVQKCKTLSQDKVGSKNISAIVLQFAGNDLSLLTQTKTI